MTILNIDEYSIELASKYVKEGGIIIYPTDTVYGLGCDPYNNYAIKRVYEIKGREKGKPLPLLCSSIEDVRRIGELNSDEEKLIKKLWPGALTLIIKLIDTKLNDILEANYKIGVRIPNNPLTLKLVKTCGGILVGTSANLSGMKSAKSVKELDKRLLEDVEIILDGGESKGVESSVVDVKRRKIVREGYVKKYEIEMILGYEFNCNYL
ncbi:MAG: L-threonylcarbamoyladenylate synthase [Candidatus Nitrosocaldaceae archaeon]